MKFTVIQMTLGIVGMSILAIDMEMFAFEMKRCRWNDNIGH
jgi:hypothetical protein